MLLTMTNLTADARDLSWLLHKRPDRVQGFGLSFGRAHVFYPEVSEARCTAALLLEVDPVGMVRGGRWRSGVADQYVNDRPYAASSFLSVAIAQVFGSALGGRCGDRPELVERRLDLVAKLSVVPARGGEDVVRFRVVGYYFESQIEDCKARNERRVDKGLVPMRGVMSTYFKLELPRYSEGFDELHHVRIGEGRGFDVAEWAEEDEEA